MILACRDVQRGEEARQKLISDIDDNLQVKIEVWQADLDDYSSITKFCQRARSSLSRLDGFIANAGLELVDFQASDDDGLERSLKVNVISTMLQAIGILPLLSTTAQKHATDTTLSIVGSMAHLFAPDAELSSVDPDRELFKALSNASTANMAAQYPLSKLLVQLCARELASIVSTQNQNRKNHVIVNVVNPGWCKTDLFRDKNDPLPVRMMLSLVGRTAEEGSRTLVHAVAQGENSHGKYLSESQVKPESVFMRSDAGEHMQKRLWKDLVLRLKGIDAEIAGFVDV